MTSRFAIAMLVAAAIAATTPAPRAATAGLAWDAVTKIAMGSDPSSLQPGNFDDDYAAAAAVSPPPSSGGGPFAGIRNAMAMGQAFEQMMQTGMAERHYVAGSKERVDRLGMGVATITDCAARTITTLDLQKKTYRVVSMDQPSASGGGGSGGGARSGDNTKVAIAVNNSTLGTRDFGGQHTIGYRSAMTFTETRDNGESHTQNADLVAYYSALAMPFPNCFYFPGTSGTSQGGAMGSIAAASRAMQVLAASGLDRRFSLTQSGPHLPAGNLAMYEALTYGAQNARGGTFVVERGNVRSIGADDPAFSIPAGFTRQQ